MVASTGNINNFEALKLFNKYRWALVLDFSISDSELSAAVTSNGVHEVQISNERTMLRSTTNHLNGDSINAEPRLRLLVAISPSSFLHSFSSLPMNVAEAKLSVGIVAPTKDLGIHIFSFDEDGGLYQRLVNINCCVKFVLLFWWSGLSSTYFSVGFLCVIRTIEMQIWIEWILIVQILFLFFLSI